MPTFPRDTSFDSTLSLAREGYKFVTNRCLRYNTDVFEGRLLLQKFIFMRGEEAARLFYDRNRFKRSSSVPFQARSTLFGKGGIQGLDGARHRRRKEMFLSLMEESRIEDLLQMTGHMWRDYSRRWEHLDRIVLLDEVHEIFARAVCNWAGVPLPQSRIKTITRELADMIQAPAAIGPRYWQGLYSRLSAERRMQTLIKNVRRGLLHPPRRCALSIISEYRDIDDKRLTERAAGAELLNVLRPTVAVARYVAFAALALHDYPECRARIEADEQYLEWFVHEVRRFYPLFPMVSARTTERFTWRGYRFPKGRNVALDLYGTNHDARIWQDPEEFIPERFRDWNGGLFNFIPQGGGDVLKTHRCPAERITVELMKQAVDFLVHSLEYDVPPQDLMVSFSRIPAQPASRFIISKVKPSRTPPKRKTASL